MDNIIYKQHIHNIFTSQKPFHMLVRLALPQKIFQKDLFITFGVITNTDTQMNAPKNIRS